MTSAFLNTIGVKYAVILVAFLTILLLFNLYHSLHWPIFHDAAIFHYVAWRISEGAVPYRDIFEMNMPGVYLIHLACISIFGKSDFAFRIFDLLILVASGQLIAFMGWKHSRLYAIFGALFYMNFHLATGIIQAGQRDFFVIPFLLLSLIAFKKGLENPASWASWLGFGIAGACMFWIKPLALCLFALCCAYVLLQRWQWPQKITIMLWIIGGATIPSLLIHGWLFYTGALPYFYDIFLHFLPIHGQMNTFANDIRPNNEILIVASLCAMGIALFYHRTLEHPTKIIAAISLTYGALHYYLQHKGWDYHQEPLFAAIGIFIATVLVSVVQQQSIHSKTMYVCVSLLAIPFFLAKTAQSSNHTKEIEQVFPAHIASVVEDANHALSTVPDAIRTPYIQHSPQKMFQIFDMSFCNLWNVAYRQQWIVPMRHMYPYPFYAGDKNPYFSLLGQELFKALAANPPLVIITCYQNWPYEPGYVYEQIDHNPQWSTWFNNHYRLEKSAPFYRIYARKP